jgi:hypothetical protein
MPLAKLTDEAVRYIRQSSETQEALAERFSVSEATINKARRRETWKHVPAMRRASSNDPPKPQCPFCNTAQPISILARECPTIAMLASVTCTRSAQRLRGKLALLGGKAGSGGTGLFLWLDKKKPRTRGESRGFGSLMGNLSDGRETITSGIRLAPLKRGMQPNGLHA